MTDDADAALATAAEALHQPLDGKARAMLNLSDSLTSTAIDLTAVAGVVARLGSGGEEEIKRPAEILDRIGDDAREGAAILRNSVTRSEVPALPTRRIPRDTARIHRVPPDPGRNPGSP
jgi:hypothetical protein